MSRAEGATAILDAAAQLGAARGTGALTLQGIAAAAGVSKGLVAYHYGGRDGVWRALAAQVAKDEAAALTAIAAAADPMEAWRAHARAALERRRLPLLTALLLEEALRQEADALWRQLEDAAATSAEALLASLGLVPRVATGLLGRVLLRHLCGFAASPASGSADEREAELDAFALALLALGR